MNAAHSSPQVPVPNVGNGGGSNSGGSGGHYGDDGGKKLRKYEIVIILLTGGFVGFVAGTLKRMMDHSSYFEAIATGVVVGFALPGFIIMIIRFIRNQS
ncbi:hypothetical protein [Streptomyces parvulus]|uniref:hypothetical protein n=1 Tax=Streptomyces parvulus TaxID=146923 RepID=UPI001CFA078E|nr:hypothetical protein [Streptomyces parvulus]